ncbi:hypothetical protein ABFU82_16570 [Nocardioides sp. WV_118_6]
MAVTLVVQVRNQDHEVVRTWQELPGEPFLRFCRKAESLGVRYVDFIWPYADAMLNFFQLASWLDDFPRVLAGGTFAEDEAVSARLVLEGAREAEALDGYLFFHG